MSAATDARLPFVDEHLRPVAASVEATWQAADDIMNARRPVPPRATPGWSARARAARSRSPSRCRRTGSSWSASTASPATRWCSPWTSSAPASPRCAPRRGVWAREARAHNHRLTWSSSGFGRLHAYELRNPGEAPAGLLLDGPLVSRHHARFELRGGTWWIVDLGSHNGTFGDGRRVTNSPLVAGSRIRIGVELVIDLRDAPTAGLAAEWGRTPRPTDVGGFKERTEQTLTRQPRIIWTLRVERYDTEGNRLRSVPVTMQGRSFLGYLADGNRGPRARWMV